MRRWMVVPALLLALADPAAAASRPRLGWLPDALLLGGGTAVAVAGSRMNASTRAVPAPGLDLAEIGWSFDRTSIGERSPRADRESDRFLAASAAYPLAVSFLSQPSGSRWSGTFPRAVVYLEALVVADGLTGVLKNSFDRPRPYTYLPEDRRPSEPSYDVTRSEAFRSMPSGHATVAFCAAAFAATDHLLTRPEAGFVERAGIPFLGGALAGATAKTRLEAGQHFPSDVLVGGLIGTASGVTVPLLHRYLEREGRRSPGPGARAWRTAAAGWLAGVGAGLLVGEMMY